MILGPSVFVTASLREGRDGGIEPNLPPGALYMELAAPELKSRWKLYECSLAPRDPRGWPGVEAVPEPLGTLLEAARGHPRAVPLARQRVMKELEGEGPVLIARETFCSMLAGFLRDTLEEPAEEFHLEIVPMIRDQMLDD